MYVRQVRVRGVSYLQIVESVYRPGKTPKQRLLVALGRGDDQRLGTVREWLAAWRPMAHAATLLEDLCDPDDPIPQAYAASPFRWRPWRWG